MSLVFIPEQTKVVLIGTSEFPEDGNLKSIKPIEANISKLGELFSNENIFGIDKTNVVSLLNKKDYEILEELENQAQQAIDTLIIYYAGHGEREKGKTLYLTATNTKKERLISTAIEFERFNKIIQSSKAKKKFLILDCCYSGLAALNSDNNPFFENELEDVQGTYIITSSPSNSVSFFHDNSTYTFFTSEFISILENGLDNQTAFIELGEMYNIIGQNLKRKSCPSPMQKNTLSGSNGQLFFANNFKYLEYSKKVNEADKFFRNDEFDKAAESYKSLLSEFRDYNNVNIEQNIKSIELIVRADKLFISKNFEEASNILCSAFDIIQITKIEPSKLVFEKKRIYESLKNVEVELKSKIQSDITPIIYKEVQDNFINNPSSIEEKLREKLDKEYTLKSIKIEEELRKK